MQGSLSLSPLKLFRIEYSITTRVKEFRILMGLGEKTSWVCVLLIVIYKNQ